VAVYKSKGIVLRSIRYGEADRILDLYTRDAGSSRPSPRASGAQSPASAPASSRSPAWTSSRTGPHAGYRDPGETLRSFHSIRENLARFEAAAGMVGSVPRPLRRRRGRPQGLQPPLQRPRRAEGRLGFEPSRRPRPKLSILAGYAPTGRLSGLRDRPRRAPEPCTSPRARRRACAECSR
jgi:DNA repair protein RecO (recombination protein O)